MVGAFFMSHPFGLLDIRPYVEYGRVGCGTPEKNYLTKDWRSEAN
jgi:hypothetical protein